MHKVYKGPINYRISEIASLKGSCRHRRRRQRCSAVCIGSQRDKVAGTPMCCRVLNRIIGDAAEGVTDVESGDVQ